MPKKYLYEIRLTRGARNPNFPQWLLNLDGLRYISSDRMGPAGGTCLVISQHDAQTVHMLASSGFDTQARETDVTVAEVTRASLNDDLGHLNENVATLCKPLSDFPNLK